MEKVLDKGPNKSKTRELKKVRGYVAPTDTGTVRTVSTHLKPVDVNVTGETPEVEPEAKIAGAPTVKEAANKIQALNNSIRKADFSKGTEKLSEATLDFFRAGVHTSTNLRLDSKDGLRKLYDEMSLFLNDIGFKNGYNLNAKDAMSKITDPNYIKTLAEKVNAVEKRIGELGLKTTRLDPFTVAIDDADGASKRILVSNNPLDMLTSQDINGKLGDNHINVLASVHQDKMNDFVFYTSPNTKGGIKGAAGVATYDPKAKQFYHHTDDVAAGSDANGVNAINDTVKKKLKAKKTSGSRSIADIEVYEVKAMITERLTTMQSEIEKQVKGEKDGDSMMNSSTASKNFIDVIWESLKKFNAEFEHLVASGAETSMAFNSPLHQKLSQFTSARNDTVKAIREAIREYAPEWKRFKESRIKR